MANLRHCEDDQKYVAIEYCSFELCPIRARGSPRTPSMAPVRAYQGGNPSGRCQGAQGILSPLVKQTEHRPASLHFRNMSTRVFQPWINGI